MRWFLAGWLAFTIGCGSGAVTITELSTTVTPPKAKSAGKCRIEFGELDDQPYCSQVKGLRDICVAELHKTMDQALHQVMDQHFTGKGEPLHGHFRFTKFSHTKLQGETELTFTWTFSLLNSQGDPLVLLDERTTSPKRIKLPIDDEEAVEAALQIIVDTIAEAVARVEI